MSAPSDLQHRLARHLSAVASEAERAQLERDVLENDTLFDQLQAFESELVDAYVRGELDESTGRGIASLIDVSPRVRAVADTTMALETRHAHQSVSAGDVRQGGATDAAAPSATVAQSKGVAQSEAVAPTRRRRGLAMAAIALLVLLMLALQTARLERRAVEFHRALEEVESENRMLREQVTTLDGELDRLESAHRDQALRLARLEARAASQTGPRLNPAQ